MSAELDGRIAVMLNWKDIRPTRFMQEFGGLTGVPPGGIRSFVPRWSSDLNLMWELVDGLNDKQKHEYGWALLEVMDGEFPSAFDDYNRFSVDGTEITERANATAEQKALAYLAVMEGKL